ncbi:MAG TPA: hypothetical protein VMK65_00180 [Longimicrobiales bacterium]|nr:hypothetical protein [Longimicrobiales bacterium]
MAAYERLTHVPVAEVIRTAEEYLTARIPLDRAEVDGHSITLRGGDGTVVIEAHRHGLSTLVHADTDQLRTSRIDVETQTWMNQLPYEPGDRPGI